MEIISQTNRTMLFEEINPEKMDLITLVGDVKGIDSLSDEKIKEINQYLLVKSFDEFLDKFSPTVYSFYNAANQKVMYTLKKPEGIQEDCISEIAIDQNNDFLKMLFTLIDTKRSQGITNVDFKFENLLDMISPKKVMDDIRQVRKEIHYLYGEYEKLDDGDPKKLDTGDKLNLMFEVASKNYNNVMAMLPLAIEDIKTRLLLGVNQDEGESEKLQIGTLSIGDNGELKIIEAPQNNSSELMVIEENSNYGLSTVFEEDYEAITESPSSYVKDLVVRTFSPLPAVKAEFDVETEVQNYNTYLEFYKNAKDEFVKTVKPLVEKLLGIKMYFDQYTTKNKGMQPSLLVTNTKLDMLVKSNNLPRLRTYLNTVNSKNDFTDTVWYGIVPALELEATGKMKVSRSRFKGNDKVAKQEGNTMESLSILLDTIKDYKVQVFFNFMAEEETTFNGIATAGIDRLIDKCSVLVRKDYSEFAIPCLPNFTIIPKDKSGVVIDARMYTTENGARLSKEKEDILKLWIEGVYVGASYVAAGIVSAYQCPEYLKESFRNVQRNYPGVRFDIEAGDHSLRAVTTMAKEISGFTNNIKDAINSRSFGFVFSSENAQLQDKDIKRITVYKARSLAMEEDGFDSIYKTQVSTYIERILRFQSGDFKHENIVRFFSNNPSSQKSKWLNDKGYVNSIIQDGDDIGYIIDEKTSTCQIDLVFNGNVKNLEVMITKGTSAVKA
ncbi:transcriptional regulator [Lysinibacillus irui]|uniref:Transcriptional regulator n=2 Tax=Lysinibacillus TaxID=400634 RepID=A0AAJ5RI89_9BACI|nr:MULTISPECIES: transcriptional regulator [Lysinibacillus]MEA0554847.1 transcriptional regulator [Lysinibacillus irui]MEA0563769.1 transcriptional regulator [Lysinibacillus irui]MEA0976562.1 transcriptional regulator [Lysinibacillus irui]MEA1042716.1 transcriptional regulator [Lysinibacillus irui]MED4552274.1 transcriptional regulator [Lysinibacillus capsici]